MRLKSHRRRKQKTDKLQTAQSPVAGVSRAPRIASHTRQKNVYSNSVRNHAREIILND